MRASAIMILAVTLLVTGASGQTTDMDAGGIIQKVRDTFERIQDYRVSISVRVDIEGFLMPDRAVVMYYKSPDRMHLEGAEFAMLPRQGLMANPSQFLDEERFEIHLVGEDEVGERTAYRLDLYLKEDDERDQPHLTVWVDAERWVIVQMEAFADGKTQGLAGLEYSLIDGDFWLPRETRVEIFLDNLPMRPAAPADEDSTRTRQQPRKGAIHLTFHDYQVNGDLPDSLFEQVERN